MTTGFASHRGLRFFRAQGPLLLLAAILAGTLGCRANCDLVEAELRTKERELDELKAALDRKDCDIEALEREVELLQHRSFKPGADAAASALGVASLTLGRLTGGLDEDPECPGDEALQVLVEPRDGDGQSIKAPGALHVDVYEISPQGLKTMLSTWELGARELRKTWETPVFGGPSYRVKLPWKSWPSTERLRVVVRLTTPDGRKFEADKDVSVRLPERPKRKADPPPLPTVENGSAESDGPCLIPPQQEILSPPRPAPEILPPLRSAPSKAIEPPTAPPPAEPTPILGPPQPPAGEITPVVYQANAPPAGPVPVPTERPSLRIPIGARPKPQ